MNPNHVQGDTHPRNLGVQGSPDAPLPRMPFSEEYVSFIVRMRHEMASEISVSKSIWHIEVEHIQSGGHWHFSTINELEDFLIASLRQEREADKE